MATRLRRAGHDLTVWNRSPERTVPLASAGAAVASSPAKAAAGAELVITMLATPEALEQVLFGGDGLAAALSPGQVLIDMSTVGPDEVRSAAARLPEGTSLVDAPVRGSVPQATSGRLEVFVQSFPDARARTQVSTAGGTQVRWSASGKEIFYLASDGKMMAVQVKTTGGFEAGVPRMLFQFSADPLFPNLGMLMT